jgi:putative CocE/NonD family hydrolase
MKAAGMIAALLAWLGAAGIEKAPAAPLPAYEAPVLYDGIDATSRYVESQDGTRLAVTVYRPSKAGAVAQERLPVIFTQQRIETPQVRYFVQRGYVWVGHDRRGVGASFGLQTGFVNRRDALDAKALIEWAGAQPFSNGKVVGIGCSNQGAWQYAVASLAPRYLVAISPACSSPQFFDDGAVVNGVPMFETRPSHFEGECAPPRSGDRQSGGVPRTATPVDEDKDGALLKAAAADDHCNAPMLGQYWLNMPRDGFNTFDGYRPGIEDSANSHAAVIRASGIAVLQIGGWFDAAGIGQLASSVYWRSRVIMGPWIHGNRAPAGSSFPDSQLDLDAELLRWFDFHAKGLNNGANEPAVVYYTLNAPPGQHWRTAQRWRWNGDGKRAWYFGAQGLTSTRPTQAQPLRYTGRDVPLFEGRYQSLNRWYAGDMAPTDEISLSQTSTPLAADLEVTGVPSARLWISADTRDANVFAVLEDVAPDGRSTFVTDGRMRASWRKIHPGPWRLREQIWHRGYGEDVAPLEPGEPAELAFDLLPISYVFKAGHSIRVSLSTSIGQPYQAPPLAGGLTPTIELHRDRARPSALLLPIVSRRM